MVNGKKKKKRISKRITDAQIAEALRKNVGYLSKAAEDLGISVQAVSKRCKKSEFLQEVRDHVETQFLDLAENQLISLIKDKNLGAICFYLKCKGKSRGYVERQEIAGPGGGPVPVKLYDFEWKGPEPNGVKDVED